MEVAALNLGLGLDLDLGIFWYGKQKGGISLWGKP